MLACLLMACTRSEEEAAKASSSSDTFRSMEDFMIESLETLDGTEMTVAYEGLKNWPGGGHKLAAKMRTQLGFRV